MSLGNAFASTMANPPALVIGCGRQAALATRLLRRAGSRAIQILDPRIDPRHWDRVIAPVHDELHGDNVIPMLGSLHDVDDLWLARARSDFAQMADFASPRIALLVGGPSKHWSMDDADFEDALARLRQTMSANRGSLLATASRRTPERWRSILRESGADLVWCDDNDGPNPYRGLLGWADAIVCTADSVNMLSEAAATAVPVYVIGADQIRGRPRAFVETLLTRRRIHPLTDDLAAFAIGPLRESARVAGLLHDWLDSPR